VGLGKIKIVSDGTIGSQGAHKGTRVLFEEAGVDGVWVDLSSVVQKAEWEIDVRDGIARAVLTVPFIALEAAADNIKVIIDKLVEPCATE